MTDERLEAIRNRAVDYNATHDDTNALLVEVDRLRAELGSTELRARVFEASAEEAWKQVQQEREACAAMAEQEAARWQCMRALRECAERIAAAIRQRGVSC